MIDSLVGKKWRVAMTIHCCEPLLRNIADIACE